MEACLAYNLGYDDIFEKLGVSLPGVIGRLPTIAKRNVPSRGIVAGAATQAAPARQGLLSGMWNKAKSYLTTKPIPGRARGPYGPASQAEGLVQPNIRDDAGLVWAKTKNLFRKPPPKDLYEQIGHDRGGAHPALVRDLALSAKGGTIPGGINTVWNPETIKTVESFGFTPNLPYKAMPRLSGKDYEDRIREAMAQQDKLRATGVMPPIGESKHIPVSPNPPPAPSSGLSSTKEPLVPSGVATVDKTRQSVAMPFRPTLLSEPPAQAVTHNTQTAVRPITQPLLPETKAASEVNMNYYDQGYADQLVHLGLSKEAGIVQGLQGIAGKVKDIGLRAVGKSKATVQARRASINEGRQAVTAAKDEKMLGDVRNKYKTQVEQIKNTPKPIPPEVQAMMDKFKPGPHATPAAPAAAPAATPTPPAGTEAEGPGSWEKFKGWWGERAPWQKAAIGAGVALPVGAGLFMAGGQNPPSVAQQQYGYQPQY